MPLGFSAIYPEGPETAAGAGADAGTVVGTNLDFPGLPVGAVPDSRDATITAAGTSVLWAPSSPTAHLVIESAFISTDVAGRIAIVADVDAQGSRIAVLYAGANGGASPNLTPAPYVCPVGAPVRVVVAGTGNVFVRVTGYEAEG
jgi:hypothetical protein